MKINFSGKSIELTPKEYTRVLLTEDEKGTKKLVRDAGVEKIEIGVGKFSEIDQHKFIILCRTIVQTAKQFKKRKIAIEFDLTPGIFSKLPNHDAAYLSSLAAQNFAMANFEFTTFKTKPKEGFTQLDEILVCGKSDKTIEAAAKRGLRIGEGVNVTRELANTPANAMTPRMLAKAARDSIKGFDTVTVKTYGRKEIEGLGMGLLAGVGSGSAEEPTFTIMEYKGAPASQKPIVLAGKGITFDSGGLNIKPSNSIYEMHMDMAGAAAVALGFHASGLLTRDNALAEKLIALGEETGDYVWRLPLWDEFEDVIKSDFADMVNHPLNGMGRYGGATVGAMFIWQFAKELDCPWAHIDIAPTMTAVDQSALAKGAAGPAVRLLLSFIELWTA